jgi:ssRNA-specific RNase YbeY (16S rRNA maturation enzyme)
MRNITSKYKDVVDKVIKNHGVIGDYEVNVFLVSEKEMRKVFDGEYHDVLSFPLDFDTTYPDGIVRLGDILVCDQEKDIEFLMKHGCLHLLGIHHE